MGSLNLCPHNRDGTKVGNPPSLPLQTMLQGKTSVLLKEGAEKC